MKSNAGIELQFTFVDANFKPRQKSVQLKKHPKGHQVTAPQIWAQYIG
jgi:hypothetical protein